MLLFNTNLKGCAVRVSLVNCPAPSSLTDVLVSLDVLQHRPLLVVSVVSSLSIGLEFLHSGGGGSARADPVHRGRHPLSEPRLHRPHLPEDLEQHRLRALFHAAVGRRDAVLCAMSHGGSGGEEPVLGQS